MKDLKLNGRKFAATSVTTSDLVVAADTCDLKKIFLFCSPVSQNGGPIDDPDLHYCCYRSTCTQKPAVNFSITDQFGGLGMQTKKPLLLCTPCSVFPL